MPPATMGAITAGTPATVGTAGTAESIYMVTACPPATTPRATTPRRRCTLRHPSMLLLLSTHRHRYTHQPRCTLRPIKPTASRGFTGTPTVITATAGTAIRSATGVDTDIPAGTAGMAAIRVGMAITNARPVERDRSTTGGQFVRRSFFRSRHPQCGHDLRPGRLPRGGDACQEADDCGGGQSHHRERHGWQKRNQNPFRPQGEAGSLQDR